MLEKERLHSWVLCLLSRGLESLEGGFLEERVFIRWGSRCTYHENSYWVLILHYSIKFRGNL